MPLLFCRLEPQHGVLLLRNADVFADVNQVDAQKRMVWCFIVPIGPNVPLNVTPLECA